MQTMNRRPSQFKAAKTIAKKSAQSKKNTNNLVERARKMGYESSDKSHHSNKKSKHAAN